MPSSTIAGTGTRAPLMETRTKQKVDRRRINLNGVKLVTCVIVGTSSRTEMEDDLSLPADDSARTGRNRL